MFRALISRTRPCLSKKPGSMKIPPNVIPKDDEFLADYEKKLATTKTQFAKSFEPEPEPKSEEKETKPKKSPTISVNSSPKPQKTVEKKAPLRKFQNKESPYAKPSEKQKRIDSIRQELEKEILKETPAREEDKITFSRQHDPLKDLESTKFKTKEQIKAEKRTQFRKKHIVDVLSSYFAQAGATPIDKLVANYFKQHREIDAPKNRHYIKDSIFNMIRNRLLVEYLYKKNGSKLSGKWEAKLDILENLSTRLAIESEIPDSIRVSCPTNFYDMLIKDFGKDKAKEIAEIYNQEAPTFGRINPLKTTREKMLEIFTQKKMEVTAGTTPYGIVFGKRYALSGIHEYQEGLFAIQDESSQLAADLMEPKVGNLVMDYCCGSGGKALAFAHKLNGKGQIYLSDISHEKLLEAKKRFSSSGVQNINPIQIGHPHLEKIKGKMNWVFVDLPCSGSGTIRRNPDQKYRIDDDYIKKMAEKQREIFEEALRFVAPSGRIVWSVCSILKDEGERQVAYFAKKYALKVEKSLSSLPVPNGMDGFYACVLKVPDFYLFAEERKEAKKPLETKEEIKDKTFRDKKKTEK